MANGLNEEVVMTFEERLLRLERLMFLVGNGLVRSQYGKDVYDIHELEQALFALRDDLPADDEEGR